MGRRQLQEKFGMSHRSTSWSWGKMAPCVGDYRNCNILHLLLRITLSHESHTRDGTLMCPLQFWYVFAILITGSPYNADWNQQRREWKQSNCYFNENSSSLYQCAWKFYLFGRINSYRCLIPHSTYFSLFVGSTVTNNIASILFFLETMVSSGFRPIRRQSMILRRFNNLDAFSRPWATVPVLNLVWYNRGHDKLVPPKHSYFCTTKWYPLLPRSSPRPHCPLRLSSSHCHFLVTFLLLCQWASIHQPPPSHAAD